MAISIYWRDEMVGVVKRNLWYFHCIWTTHAYCFNVDACYIHVVLYTTSTGSVVSIAPAQTGFGWIHMLRCAEFFSGIGGLVHTNVACIPSSHYIALCNARLWCTLWNDRRLWQQSRGQCCLQAQLWFLSHLCQPRTSPYCSLWQTEGWLLAVITALSAVYTRRKAFGWSRYEGCRTLASNWCVGKDVGAAQIYFFGKCAQFWKESVKK